MKHFLEGPDRDLNLVFMTEGYCIFLALAVLFSAYLPSWSILGLELRNFSASLFGLFGLQTQSGLRKSELQAC